MATENEIWLGPSGSEALLSEFGRKLKIYPIEIARQDRTASGKGVKDIIATKKGFNLSYSLILDSQLQTVQGYYDLGTTLSLKVYFYAALTTYTVIMKPFDQDRIIAVGDKLWGNVVFDFEEE